MHAVLGILGSLAFLVLICSGFLNAVWQETAGRNSQSDGMAGGRKYVKEMLSLTILLLILYKLS